MVSLQYSYRPFVLGAERHYRLEPDALVWQNGRREGRLLYADIDEAQLFKIRFFGRSATYWNCILIPRSGRKIRLCAASRTGFRTIEDRSATCTPFLQELLARIATANPNFRRVEGRHWLSSLDAIGGRIMVGLVRIMRYFDLQRSANAGGWVMRRIGPWLRGHCTARAQVIAAYPDKSAADIEKILDGMWDNIGRVFVEYAHLDRLWRYDPSDPRHSHIIMDAENDERCRRLQRDVKPALMFAAHLANWELPPHAATAGGRPIALVYRPHKVNLITTELTRIRSGCVAALIPATRNTPMQIRKTLQRGWMVGMLVDQHYAAGINVMFFNRRCRVNPLLARLAKLFDCPIHGSRVIRLPNGKFRFEVTEALELPRSKDGTVDVAATMQMVTSIIEGWVREHPEQWMWLHRRWR